MITTKAWVIHQGPPTREPEPAELVLEDFSFPDITEDELLVEPIYGCWEGNMTHTLRRTPIDACRLRGEAKVVVGNAGVVRVLKAGSAVESVREGSLGIVLAVGDCDPAGYPKTIFGYDAPGTIGLLAKRTKFHRKNFSAIPENTKYSLKQWAAFSLRYPTAWDNWRVAYGCWRLQMDMDGCPTPFVWGWGGGVALAEVSLARFFDCRTAMISSHDERLTLIGKMGITPIDRQPFMDLYFDQQKYETDFTYRKKYLRAEKTFLTTVEEHTEGAGVSVFVDNIGAPVHRATLKALGRQGVITSVGWKGGMDLSVTRATECINRHIHVYTHGSHYSPDSIGFAEEKGWMPPVGEDAPVYGWDDIPRLARKHAEGNILTYFPLYQVNVSSQ